jgi:hypothetical protein
MMRNLHQLCLEGITAISTQEQKTGAVKRCNNFTSFSFKKNYHLLPYWIWYQVYIF